MAVTQSAGLARLLQERQRLEQQLARSFVLALVVGQVAEVKERVAAFSRTFAGSRHREAVLGVLPGGGPVALLPCYEAEVLERAVQAVLVPQLLDDRQVALVELARRLQIALKGGKLPRGF